MSKIYIPMNEFGWYVVAWIEDGYRKQMSYDTYKAALSKYCELKKKGLL